MSYENRQDMSNKKSTTSKLISFLNILLKAAVIILACILIHTIYKGLQQDGYTVQSLQVPKYFSDNGYNGYVVANRIQDEIINIKRSTKSSRNDSLQVVANKNNDLRMDVMGIGVSSNSLTYHLKDLLGIETKMIGGDLTQLGNELNLTLRVDGFPTKQISELYDPASPNVGFENMIKKASEHILYCVDPYYLALKRINEKKYEEAKSILRNIIQNHPEDAKWAYIAWGKIKRELQDKESEIEFYKMALHEDPTFVNANRSLAWIYFTNREYEEAIPYFEESLKADKENFGSNNGLAMSYAELGRHEEAEIQYKKNIKYDPDNLWAYTNYGGFLLGEKGDTSGFINLYKDASQSIKHNDEYYFTMASISYMEKDSEKAMYYLDKTLDYNPENIGALNIMARVQYYQEKDFVAAENTFRKLIDIYNRGSYDHFMKAGAFNMLALAEHNQGKLDSALVHAKRAVKHLPDLALPYTTLAEVYFLMGNKEKFYEIFQIAIDKGLEFEEDWWKDEPYTQLIGDERLLAMLDDSKLKN